MPNTVQFLPGIDPIAMKGGALNELETAIAIAEGTLSSPQRVRNVTLFAIRITGTGTSYRQKGEGEFVYRIPEEYLTNEFMARCSGLPVIIEHPEETEDNKLGILNAEEFKERMVGTVFLPYIDVEKAEVWGIAKIYDDAAIELMTKNQLSTSPSVVFTNADDNDSITLDDGSILLIEGKPRLLDHVAICLTGVWDKAGPPSGIISETEKGTTMDEAERKAAEEAKAKADAEAAAAGTPKAGGTGEGATLEKVLEAIAAVGKRVEALEQKQESHAISDSEKAAQEEKAKADAEEAKAKADEAERAALQERIAAVENAIPKPISDADYAEMAEVQAQADSVAHAFGDSAPRPLQGETLLAYRKRLASKFKAHSETYSSIDLTAINDSNLFAVVEKQIYSDAMKAARNPAVPPEMGLREVKQRDQTGRQISTFHGMPSAWTSQFKSPARRVTAINKGA